MKIQHLQYALEVAKMGSINKAAEKLYLSQPNLSSAIKTLEGELGFAIFIRKNSGTTVTPEGQEFLLCARNIVQQYQQMTAIKTGQRTHRLHLSAGYHSVIEEAFALLCAEYPREDRIDFSLLNTGTETTIERVYLNKSNLGILLLPQGTPGRITSLCEKRGMEARFICTLQFYVSVNQNHPLLKTGHLEMEKLWDYPFVDYSDLVLSASMNLDDLHVINPDKRIAVDNRDTRFHIVTISDAFSVGCSQHPRIKERYPLVNIPLPGMFFKMVAIHRGDQPLTPEARRYLQLLEQQAALLD